MSLIEKYKAWVKYPEKYTSAQVLTEIVADLIWLEQEQAKNCNIQRVVRSCYWCDVPITDNDEVEELPEGRGEAHKKCADEWYGCQMADD